MSALLDLAHPEELIDYVYETGHGVYVDPAIYVLVPDLTKEILDAAIDAALTEGYIDYSVLAFQIETNLPELEE